MMKQPTIVLVPSVYLAEEAVLDFFDFVFGRLDRGVQQATSHLKVLATERAGLFVSVLHA